MSESEPKTNIGPEVAALLKRLGLDPPTVKELHLTPTTATVTIFKRTENGGFALEPAPVAEYLPGLNATNADVNISTFSSRPVTETLEFEVRT